MNIADSRSPAAHGQLMPGKFKLLVALVVAIWVCNSHGGQPAEDLVVESSRMKLVLHENLKGIAQLIDKQTGRDYAAGQNRSFGLYMLYFGKSFLKAKRSSASNVASKELTRIENGVRLRFEQKGTHPALVDCIITARADEPAIRFGIDVTNRSNQPLCAIDYPLVTCRPKLGESSADDRILYPQHEGILLCDPERNMPVGTTLAKAYPGSASAQFAYFFDPGGGLYCAAEDIQGLTKTLLVRRESDGLAMTWRHELPSVRLGRTELEYDIVWSAGRSTWQDGADIYRTWIEESAPWCEKKISASAAPDWLQQVNVFLNYQLDLEGEFYGAEEADAAFKAYGELFGLPIVACAFGWEKHGTWIGPDYFPPRGGEDYYTDLSRRLTERGDHMHVFTSGFRWGVRKALVPVPQPAQSGGQQLQAGYSRSTRGGPPRMVRSVPRRYTDYNGRRDFYSQGRHAVAIDGNRRDIYERRDWAENYLLCAGSIDGRKLIGDCFAQIYDLGISGVDLDQNLGAGIPHCYSDHHDHPPGAGWWQHESMYEFLEGVRAQAREKHDDSFIGVEEPCEAYIPVVDIVHGRAFTDTVWPAAGPGAVSVPLYLYLYHQYQLHYAGWIDGGFSPFGDVRCGIGRATIFGMQPGVRIGKGPFQFNDDEPSAELIMLRDAAQITHRCRDYLVLGRMLHDPNLKGAPIASDVISNGRPALPIDWPLVQATAWQSAAGNICYAVANLSDAKRTVQLLTHRYGTNVKKVSLTRINADSEQILRASTALPIRVTLELEPWQISCVEQRATGLEDLESR